MNILFLSRKVSSSCGVDIVTRTLANEFINFGHNVNLCSLEIFDNLLNPKIKHFFIFGDWRKIDSLKNIGILKNVIREEKIDIVINQNSQDLPWCRLCFVAKQSAKIINCLHLSLLMLPHTRAGFLAKILPAFLVYKLKVYREIRRRNFAYKYSDAFVFLSQKFIEQYQKLQSNKNLNKLHAIANPLEFPNIEFTDLKVKNKTVIFVARIQENQKRPSFALEVWKLLYEKNPEWNLLFLGDGEDLPILKEKAKKTPRVEFFGFQNPEPYYEKASILLQTSTKDFEGFGMTLVEAQKNACVPVATDSYLSLSDIIENEKNGFITPYNDINAMAEKVQILINNESLRKKMAFNGVQSVKKFDVKVIAQEWEKLFNEL